MIWFDASSCYGSPSYYVQKMYACNMGNATLEICDYKAAKGIYCSASISEKDGEVILKLVNPEETERVVEPELPEGWSGSRKMKAVILTGAKREETNSIRAYSFRLDYSVLESMPREARTELETTVDYYADLFVPFLKVCQGKESFVQVREFIDEIYSFYFS